ncbi:transposase [Bradyrhizobium sp. BR13661]|uniref:IS66 family transposase n=1 Tax=Bradyrhizobium sp. BR13661 TaxID=2940622 RepID=UPI002475B75B|nr:transposase [Bradyrhizobium sp. BR13661]
MGRTQLFINDSSIDFGNNMVERSIRPIALTRKNALFAASLAEPSREQQSRC